MSKVDVKKVVEDVSICSEILSDISKGLSSVSSKLSSVSKLLAQIVSELEAEGEDAAKEPAVVKESKKDGGKEASVDVAKSCTFVELRTFLADKSRAGHTAEIKEILARHGADKLSKLDESEYAAVMAEAEVLE